MDRLNQIRGEAGSSRDLTLDTTSPPSEAYMTANDSSSKYFSLSEVDSTFSISPSKDATTTNADSDRTVTVESELISNLSPIPKKGDLDSYKIGKQIEAANILSGGVNIFDDNENSYDGDELVIDDNVVIEDDKGNELKIDNTELPLEKNLNLEPIMLEDAEIPSKDTEVVLQIDGKNVDAIDIGNGLYLYRKAGQEELAAVQIIDDDQQQPSFKFLKVRENNEGNLEVYEEIEIEIPKEVPVKEKTQSEKISHVPIKDISKVKTEPASNKNTDKVIKTPVDEAIVISELVSETESTESKAEVNLNGKTMKFSESRKSPLIGTYTPMTYHSTPNKEGIPLTKTMVDQQLHPSRHSDNVKKTIEVNTDSCRQKLLETPTKNSKDLNEPNKTPEEAPVQDEKQKNENESELSTSPTKDETILHESVHTPDDVAIDESNVPNKSETNLVNDNTPTEKTKVSSTDMVMDFEDNVQKKIDLTTQEQNKSSPLKNVEICQENIVVEKDNVIKEKEQVKIVQENKNVINEEPAMGISNEIVDSKNVNGELVKDVIDVENDTILQTHKLLQEDRIDESKKEETLAEPAKLHLKPSIEKIENTTNETVNKIKTVLEVTKKLKNPTENVVIESSNDTDEKEKTSLESEKQTSMEDNKCNNVKKSETNTPSVQSIPTESNLLTSIKENLKTVEISTSSEEEKKFSENCIHSKEGYQENQNMLESNNQNQDSDKKKDNGKLVSNKDTVNKEQKKSETSNTDKSLQPKEITIQTNTKNYQTQSTTKLPLPKEPVCTQSIGKEIKTNIPTTNKVVSEAKAVDKKTIEAKREIPKPTVVAPKANNNNNSGVPFGKWTEANRQEFLNKIKETKVPSNYPNTKQLKQPNDLNRRDVLKKMDTKRQSTTASTKIIDFGTMSKVGSKVETPIFVNKSTVNQPVSKQDTKIVTLNPNTVFDAHYPIVVKNVSYNKTTKPVPAVCKPQRKGINNQDLIEGIINRAMTGKVTESTQEKSVNVDVNTTKIPDSFDDIEKRMNELHGIPFEDRSAKEISQINKNEVKNKPKVNITKIEKVTKIPILVPFKKDEKILIKEKVAEEISDEEIIEHEPITGDIEVNKQSLMTSSKIKPNEPNNEGIITEKDFDKFARRNSVTYENCLTMSFDSKETHSVKQTIVEKDAPAKKLSRNELMLAESKAKSANKLHLIKHNTQANKFTTSTKSNEDDAFSKTYQSKVQMAYQSVMTKRSPITIIEDKPVKVVYMDSNNIEYTPMQSNIQGQELSPSTKLSSDSSDAIHSASESLDSDILDTPNEIKSRGEAKLKSKHQRKQVLTPVEEPELELIEPRDLGIEISPKKKRKIDDKNEKVKNLVPKKSYLLNRNTVDEEVPKPHELITRTANETKNTTESLKIHTDTISAIDNLVKAAELIENQAENKTANNDSKSSLDDSLNTPVKRGRGRPRKYPLPDQVSDVKAPSPQKKPRLIDAKATKTYSDTDESSDDELVKENWTMGKINEDIVCPICNKLFRSENVVFKHVKHCTGPSPNRSDSDQRSPTRRRRTPERKYRESSSDFTDDDDEKLANVKSRKSRQDYTHDQDDVIVIEDTPIKEKPQKVKNTDIKKNVTKTKLPSNTNNLMCEFCGKTFRQLSYLVNHKLQHKKKEPKSLQTETEKSNFSCETCKKEFRKLHHLVQHRQIHNTNLMPPRQHRKSSSEPQDSKSSRRQSETKQSDDPSAGFRCEPCDKSFRKLHHLVEHRETHDGISKKGASHLLSSNDGSKSSQAYHCDVCKKSYRKLQDFLEHKEQHLETSSEKSDDKSVKSSLSTKDIIHECSLCYMVFPNEHSLNKHTIICLRKKKQSAAKQAAKKTEGGDTEIEEIKLDDSASEEMVPNKHVQKPIETEEIKHNEDLDTVHHNETIVEQCKSETVTEKDTNELNKKRASSESKPLRKSISGKSSSEEHKQNKTNTNDAGENPLKVENIKIKEYIIIPDTPTPKKKLAIKEKIAPTVTKRHRSLNVTMPVVNDAKPVESSDDDEVRYMLNPNYKEEENSEIKTFMKVKARKRNSLQIERPNSKDLIKRRISLQHPPKIPRLKVKAVEPRPISSLAVEKKLKLAKIETLPNTDSDDSDVKYSFPVQNSSDSNIPEKKSKRHSLSTKRKSLVGIAKRKSMGKHKLATPISKIKKRTTDIEHRCDCGQLFSSAALLSRHTTLAHTPPRIRRRRSPPPDLNTQTSKDKQTNPIQMRTNKTKPIVVPKKPKNDVTKTNTTNKSARKSSVNNGDAKVANSSSKAIDSSAKTIVNEPIGKVLRSAAHRGVPVPEKMRKLMEKSKK